MLQDILRQGDTHSSKHIVLHDSIAICFVEAFFFVISLNQYINDHFTTLQCNKKYSTLTNELQIQSGLKMTLNWCATGKEFSTALSLHWKQCYASRWHTITVYTRRHFQVAEMSSSVHALRESQHILLFNSICNLPSPPILHQLHSATFLTFVRTILTPQY